ncbi:MAG TPA: hypothetical protein VLP43_03600, partial [Solirubrobacteraceae bacterium]|nr:hypothetical protein [Solirubrobacteraceae bacterium]
MAAYTSPKGEGRHQDAGPDAPRSTITWEQDPDGIVTLTLDDPSQSANTMNQAYMDSMAETVERLEAEK